MCEHLFVVHADYVYLLGLYLGDGNLSRSTRSYELRITLDARYPETVESAAAALRRVVPHGRAHVRRRRGAYIVASGWKDWPELFPQHGSGKKHKRVIALAGWQRALADEYPQQFLRGLINSDGCRVVNRFAVDLPSGRRKQYAYPRYFFSNLSPDIRQLFCEYCDLVGVRWTRSNHRNISVAHRHSVAVLDSFIGDKR
jgi:hypothetical protein